jgi:hypothetical protein
MFGRIGNGKRIVKALTICQPYAEFIVRGQKRVENRTWPTKHRGQMYIHAGKSREWFDDDEHLIREFGRMPPFGAVVAIANLIDCVPYNNTSFDKYPWLAKHEHANGPWCWILDRITPIGPWPYRGAQGLFDINDLDEVANRELGITSTGARSRKS